MASHQRIDIGFYSHQPRIVFGFHGCDKSVRDKVLNNPKEHLNKSNNPYDWLGEGVYFWLNDPMRAYEWAVQKKKREPAVIGAIIELGDCLNLCERHSIKLLADTYEQIEREVKATGLQIKPNKAPDEGGFALLRYLDCAVIERLHANLLADGLGEYDTVYGVFQESEDAYPGAGFKAKTHIQICVRNLNCIKGYFLPRDFQN